MHRLDLDFFRCSLSFSLPLFVYISFSLLVLPKIMQIQSQYIPLYPSLSLFSGAKERMPRRGEADENNNKGLVLGVWQYLMLNEKLLPKPGTINENTKYDMCNILNVSAWYQPTFSLFGSFSPFLVSVSSISSSCLPLLFFLRLLSLLSINTKHFLIRTKYSLTWFRLQASVSHIVFHCRKWPENCIWYVTCSNIFVGSSSITSAFPYLFPHLFYFTFTLSI